MNEHSQLNHNRISQKKCPHALGKHLPMIETNGLILTETRHGSNLSVAKHSHERANLVCVLQGSFTENIGIRNYECYERNILLKPAEESHATHYNQGGAQCLVIEVEPKRLSYYSPKIFDEVTFIQMLERFDLIHQIYGELNLVDDVSKMAIEGLTLELLAHFTRKTRHLMEARHPRWLLEAKDFIHANFSSTVSLSVIAEIIGIHPSRLARVFRQQFHCSIGDYIRRLRLEYAAKELIQSEKSFSEIASTAGFYDQSHFANAFKRYTGLTPTEYRALKN